MARNVILFIGVLFCVYSIELKAQVWEQNVNGTFFRIHDVSSPVRGVFIFRNNFSLFDNADIVAFCQKHNVAQTYFSGSSLNPNSYCGTVSSIQNRINQAANLSGRAEMVHAGWIFTGLSAGGAYGALMTNCPEVEGKILAVVVYSQPYYYPLHDGIPQLFNVAGNDGFGIYGYDLAYMEGNGKARATKYGIPFTVTVQPGVPHNQFSPNQSFTAIWLDAIMRLRAPLVPSAASLPLPSFQNYNGWCGKFDAGNGGSGAPWNNGSKMINVSINSLEDDDGLAPYIWLPDECTAIEWQNFSESAFTNGFCTCEKSGLPCEDNDPCTINKFYDDECNCIGEFLDANSDGVCDIYNCIPGSPCDDGNPCTVDDTFNNRCECIGTRIDADKDAVCDIQDVCPSFHDEKVGSYCDNDIDKTGFYSSTTCTCVQGPCEHEGTRCNLSQSGYWWLDLDCNCIPYSSFLSAQLLSFKVFVEGYTTVLRWEFDDDDSDIEIIVQRASNPSDFFNLDSLTIDKEERYKRIFYFHDPMQVRGKVYYRIVYKSSKEEEWKNSPIRVVYSTENERILISPNPAHNFLFVDKIEDCQRIYILTTQGDIVLTKDISQVDDVKIDISLLPSGLYFLRTDMGKTERFIKQ